MLEIRKCPSCGENVVGRIDKIFCCDQCRNTYNNKKKRITEEYIININRILRKNRKILSQLNPEGKSSVRKSVMEKLGFNFKYHTHLFTSANNNTYYFNYEFGYMFIDDGIKILIVNEQAYMKT